MASNFENAQDYNSEQKPLRKRIILHGFQKAIAGQNQQFGPIEVEGNSLIGQLRIKEQMSFQNRNVQESVRFEDSVIQSLDAPQPTAGFGSEVSVISNKQKSHQSTSFINFHNSVMQIEPQKISIESQKNTTTKTIVTDLSDDMIQSESASQRVHEQQKQIQMSHWQKVQILGQIPMFQSLVPCVLKFLFEKVSVEVVGYDQELELREQELDFLFVTKGQLRFKLQRGAISMEANDDVSKQRNFYLGVKQHVCQNDLQVEKQFLSQVSDSNKKINSELNASKQRKANIFFNTSITEVRGCDKNQTIVIRLPYIYIKLFMLDKYALQPKFNPWGEKEFQIWIMSAYPSVLPKVGYKFKEQLLDSIQIQVFQKGTLLAQEGTLLKGENLITVVSGNLRFFKRMKDQKSISPFGQRLEKVITRISSPVQEVKPILSPSDCSEKPSEINTPIFVKRQSTLLKLKKKKKEPTEQVNPNLRKNEQKDNYILMNNYERQVEPTVQQKILSGELGLETLQIDPCFNQTYTIGDDVILNQSYHTHSIVTGSICLAISIPIELYFEISLEIGIGAIDDQNKIVLEKGSHVSDHLQRVENLQEIVKKSLQGGGNSRDAKCKSQLSEEFLSKFRYADHNFKQRITKILAQRIDEGKPLLKRPETKSHQLYGYIENKDLIRLEQLKNFLKPDYQKIEMLQKSQKMRNSNQFCKTQIGFYQKMLQTEKPYKEPVADDDLEPLSYSLVRENTPYYDIQGKMRMNASSYKQVYLQSTINKYFEVTQEKQRGENFTSTKDNTIELQNEILRGRYTPTTQTRVSGQSKFDFSPQVSKFIRKPQTAAQSFHKSQVIPFEFHSRISSMMMMQQRSSAQSTSLNELVKRGLYGEKVQVRTKCARLASNPISNFTSKQFM